MNSNTLSLILKIVAVLWIIWGAVHAFAGVMTISLVSQGDISTAIGNIADGTDKAAIQMEYHGAVGAILSQHGWNLLWGGLLTLICAFYIWGKKLNAIVLAALVGGLLDLGYFIFLDLGGYVNFVPGTVMTLISLSAILLSILVYVQSDKMAVFHEGT